MDAFKDQQISWMVLLGRSVKLTPFIPFIAFCQSLFDGFWLIKGLIKLSKLSKGFQHSTRNPFLARYFLKLQSKA